VRYRTALRPVATPPNPTLLPEIDLLLPAASLKWFQAHSEELRTRLPLSCGLRLGVLQPASWVRYRTALRPEMLDGQTSRRLDAQESHDTAEHRLPPTSNLPLTPASRLDV